MLTHRTPVVAGLGKTGLLTLIVVISCSAVAAQQTNVLAPVPCALMINGSGMVDGSGTAVGNDSMVRPTPAGSAPFFHHRAAAQVPVQMRIIGEVGSPLILAYSSSVLSTPISLGGVGLLDLDPTAMQFIVDAFDPTSWQNLGAFVGSFNTWTFTLPSGLPAGIPAAHFQAAVVSPSYPAGMRLTASVTMEVRDDLDTLARNFVDGLTEAPENPFYLVGTLASNFKLDGDFAYQFVADLAGDPLVSADYVGIGRNSTDPAVPALPTGAPLPGDSVTLYLQGIRTEGTGCGSPDTEGGQFRAYDFQVVEENGAWKLAGNRRDARVELGLVFEPGPNQGLRVLLTADVRDRRGRRGGITGVTLTGPQLGSVVAGTATTPASGTLSLAEDWRDGTASAWTGWVELADSFVGSSRMPLVEHATTGPRDTYTVVVSWQNGSTSTFTDIPLRAALDVSANPAAVVAALPAPASPGGSPALTSPGTAAATVQVTVDLGAGPQANLMSGFMVDVFQTNTWLSYELGSILYITLSSPQPVVICTPSMDIGNQVQLALKKWDVFNATYRGFVSFVP